MSEWINVKDRLPEDGEHVLCFHFLGSYLVAQHFDDDIDIWRMNGGKVRDIISWMPLPEPPKEER